jgi:U4/U6.U5 tri-snRNP component SNU23
MSASTTNDTVRKTWDREEYLQKNKEREKNYKRRQEDIVPDSHLSIAGAREGGLGLEQEVNKTILISAKDEGSKGFKCDACGVSFNDNLSYLDHLNSIQRTD